MESDEDLFLKIVAKLNNDDLLQQIVLIGSWALPVYKAFFNNDPEIPVLRTTDVDFLIGNPPGITGKFDIPKLLKEIGFEADWSSQGEFCKYVHPDAEIEFLIADYGPGKNHSIVIKELGLHAMPLRFLSLAYDYSMIVDFKGYRIRVPEPEAFLILKLLVIPGRKKESKRQKDIYTAKLLFEFLNKRKESRITLKEIYGKLPNGWQAKIKIASEKYLPAILELLNKD